MPPAPANGPLYLALEGPEGCGKSTQAARIAAALGAVLTRETGGTPVGERLRSILHDVELTDLDARAEALLIAADRAQHLATVVRPTLAAGRSVVSDRSVYSSLAYQGYGRGLDVAQVRSINAWAMHETWPDVIVLLSVPTAELNARMRRRDLDRFEREDAAFHQRVVDGFAALAAADPTRWIVIDASEPPDDVTTRILEALAARTAARAAPGSASAEVAP